MSVPPDQIAQLMQQYPNWQNQLQQYMKTQGKQQAIPGGIGLGQSPQGIGLGRQGPQSRMGKRGRPQNTMPADMQAKAAAMQMPWGEGKAFSSQPEWADAMHNATKDYQFDPNSGDNTQTAYFSALNQEKLAKESAAKAGIQYQTSPTMQAALDKFAGSNTLDQSLANVGNWTEQDYRDRGYTLQTDPNKEKLGLQAVGFQNWAKPAALPAAQPQASQQAPAGQAGMPTTLPAQGQTPKAASGATMPNTQQPPAPAQNPKAASGAQFANAMQPPPR